MEKHKVIFYPYEKKVLAENGETIFHAALRAGLYLNSICGGTGTCKKCIVTLKKGSVIIHSRAGEVTEKIETGPGKNEIDVFACQTGIKSDLIVEIPDAAHPDDTIIMIDDLLEKDDSEKLTEPITRKHLLKLSAPTIHDNASDLRRIYRALKPKYQDDPINTPLTIIHEIPYILRDSSWNVTATVAQNKGFYELIRLEGRDRTESNYGLAVDIGTTTIATVLLDLGSGKTLSKRASYNPQIALGEDIITRIMIARETEDLARLKTSVKSCVNELIMDMSVTSGIDFNDISAAVFSGNTTMIHLFLGIHPENIRIEPYVPVVNSYPFIKAEEAGMHINPEGYLICLPCISSFVGADITAGIMSCGIDNSESISILMDIGTNGEVVLGCREWIMCCSCSAGPAFEGGGIDDGMRAGKGAIQSISIDTFSGRIQITTIGDMEPKGICGSGLIEIIAELLIKKIVDRAGKINADIMPERTRTGENGIEFIICFKGEKGSKKDIKLSEADIANVIRAKGALYAGTDLLLKKAGIKFENVDKFYISGGFGCSININHAITIGLLPEIPPDKFEFVGNSSLSGAKMVLLSSKNLSKAEKIANNATNIELSNEPDFMNDYTSTLFLPHTHIERFPNVAKILGIMTNQ